MSRARAVVAALAAGAALAAPAAGADVRLEVVNEAAPSVRILAPADGARLPAGAQIEVRAQARDAQRLWMSVDGRRAWSTRGDVLQATWAPPPGPSRLVAVAERDGAPDAIAVADVVGVPPQGAPADASPGAAAPPPAAGGPGAAPGAARMRAPTRSRPAEASPGAARSPAGAGPIAAPPAAPAPWGGGRAAAGAPAPAGAADDGGGGGGGWTGALREFLRDPERVAWSVALPLLLMIAGGAYALLQRFIDGGQKLAWRGRGRPDDEVIEF